MSVESILSDVQERLRNLGNAVRLQGRKMSAAAPADNELLGWNDTTKKWEPKSSVPAVRAYNNAAISIANNTVTALTFNSERWDTDTIHSTSSNTGRLTATTAGKYGMGGNAQWSADPVNATIYIKLNGATFIAQDGVVADYRVMNISTEYDLAAGDYIELAVKQISGGPINIEAASNISPEFWMSRKGPRGSASGAVGDDHGTLTGLGDDDHAIYLLAAGSRAGSTGAAQDFGATGIKADVVAESTGAAGVTIDGVLLKDSSITAGKSLAAGGIKFPDAGALTVSAGVITATGTFHSVIPESGTSDEIDTINGGTDGMVLILRPDLDTYLIDLKHGTGNIEIQGETDIRLSNTEEVAWLVYDGTLSKWLVSNPGTAAHTHASAATGGIMANPRLTGYLQFAEDGSAPIPSANTIRLVGLDDGGVTKLYYRASDGTTYGPLVGYTDAEAVTAVKRETHITLAHSVSGVAFSS